MSFVLEFTKIALSDIEKHRKTGNKAILNKIAQLLNELKDNPEERTGKVELMKCGLSGKYSRRINHRHRLVYSINKDSFVVTVFSLWGH